MTSYLLRAHHVVPLPSQVQSSPEEVTDWLERTLRVDGVELVRTGETLLEFRSTFRVWDPNRSNDSLGFLANGEIEVRASSRGPVIWMRANPRTWYGLIAVAWFGMMLGWGNVAGVLRWGAGLGGIILGGVYVFLIWGSINSFLQYKSWVLRMLRTRDLPAQNGGAA